MKHLPYIAVLAGLLIGLGRCRAAKAADTWYVRPASALTNNGDGTAYAEAGAPGGAGAWDGFESIVWGVGGVVAGDTLYVCDTWQYPTDFASGATVISGSGTDGSPITVRGDLADHAGVIIGARKLASGSFTPIGDNSYYASASWGNPAWQGDPTGTPELLQAIMHYPWSVRKASSTIDVDVGTDTITVDPGGTVASYTGKTISAIGTELVALGVTLGTRMPNLGSQYGSILQDTAGAQSINSTYYVRINDANGIALCDDLDGSCYWDDVNDVMYVNPWDDAGIEDVYYNFDHGLLLNGSDYITLDGLSLFGGTGNDGVLRLCKSGSGSDTVGIIVQNCEIAFGAYTGIYASGYNTSYVTIVDTTIHDCASGTYFVSDGDQTHGNYTMRRVEVYGGKDVNNCYTLAGADKQALGGMDMHDLLIEYCYIHDWGGKGIENYSNLTGAGCVGYNVTIRYTKIDNLYDDENLHQHLGIHRGGSGGADWPERCYGWKIYGNVISRLGDGPGSVSGECAGIRLKGSGGTTDQEPKIYNNTFYQCQESILWITNGATDPNRGFDFRNNISLSPTGGYHMYIGSCVGTDKAITSTNNYWYPDTAGSDYKFLWDGVDRDNFADFVADALSEDSVSIGSNSAAADPVLTDPAIGDLSLNTGSPCEGAAYDLGTLYDDMLDLGNSTWTGSVVLLDGDLYGTGRDIGADVFGARNDVKAVFYWFVRVE